MGSLASRKAIAKMTPIPQGFCDSGSSAFFSGHPHAPPPWRPPPESSEPPKKHRSPASKGKQRCLRACTGLDLFAELGLVVMMIVVIQHCESLDYLGPDGSWVKDPEDAVAFPSSVAALLYMNEKHLASVQIVLTFSRREFDVEVGKSEGC
jgi:hypothetical protein